jgi:hypothetical protein
MKLFTKLALLLLVSWGSLQAQQNHFGSLESSNTWKASNVFQSVGNKTAELNFNYFVGNPMFPNPQSAVSYACAVVGSPNAKVIIPPSTAAGINLALVQGCNNVFLEDDRASTPLYCAWSSGLYVCVSGGGGGGAGITLTTTGTSGPATLTGTVLNIPNYSSGGGGGGSVNSIGVTTGNGVSGTSSGGSDPRLSFVLGDITPSSVATGYPNSGANSLILNFNGLYNSITLNGVTTDGGRLGFVGSPFDNNLYEDLPQPNSIINYRFGGTTIGTATNTVFTWPFFATTGDGSGTGGGISYTEGVAPVSPFVGVTIDAIWADSGTHHFATNLNNIGMQVLPVVTTAGTPGHVWTVDTNGYDLVDGGALTNGISGQTAGYFTIATGATTIGAPASLLMDYNITTVNAVTLKAPFGVVNGSLPPGFSMTPNGVSPAVVTGAWMLGVQSGAMTGQTWVAPSAPCSGTITSTNVSGIMTLSCTSGGTPTYPLTIVGGVSGGVVYGNTATQLTVSPAGTTNVLMKWGGAGSPPTNSSCTDNGTVLNCTETIEGPNGSSTVAGIGLNGTAIGLAGASGNMLFVQASVTRAEVTSSGIGLGANALFGAATVTGTADVGLSRIAAGVDGVGTGAVGSTAGSLRAASYQAAGTKFTATGCTVGATTGGATAGTYASGTTGSCAVTITTGITATTGWACHAADLTTNADIQTQTASTTTTATITGTTVSGDIITFGCIGY